MTHLLVFALCVSAFGALAAATRRQQRDFFGRQLSPTATNMFRLGGATGLLLALVLLVREQGLGLGLVMFSGHTSLAAGINYSSLIGVSLFERRS